MEYLIRFAQFHETFRLPEIQSLAALEGINLEVIHYSLEVGLADFWRLSVPDFIPGPDRHTFPRFNILDHVLTL